MVRVYPDFDEMIREAAQKWSEANGLLFQKVSYADPLTNADTISLSVKFKDIGCLEECVEVEKISIPQGFTNNTDQKQKETLETITYVENLLTWENDFHFVLPGQNFLTIPRVPRSVHMDINPGFLVNFFGRNQLFHTKIREPRPIRAEVFLEPSSNASIQLQVEKQHVSQPYQMELSMLGSIIVTAQDRGQEQGTDRYVDLTDLIPFLCPHKNFSSKGRALIFLEQGTFKGILSRKIRAYATQMLHCDGKTLEYEIPLNNPLPESALRPKPMTTNATSCGCSSDRPSVVSTYSHPSNPTTYSQQPKPMTTNATSCGCSACMSATSNKNLYTEQ
ncbi:hypothetical protein [Bacillus mycoides]|uniref:hypothetical protein n=1 Tax=Bacillus mycoides TaxID=1405 RepID=UPI002E1D2230|nr:hypothetical protein [Bacillus mycoides]